MTPAPARDLAERFADELPRAIADAPPAGRLAWELAAPRAGLVQDDVLIIDDDELAFLIGEQWVVEPGDAGWRTRPWLDNADPRYAGYQDMINPPEPD